MVKRVLLIVAIALIVFLFLAVVPVLNQEGEVVPVLPATLVAVTTTAHVSIPTATLVPIPTSEPTSVLPTTWSAIGLLVHYDDCWTAIGKPFDPMALTCAVDDSLWPELRCRTLRITRLDNARSVVVTVNDWGYLYRAGWFTYDVRQVGKLDIARWWPAPPYAGYHVVIDTTIGVAALLKAEDTTLVLVEELP